MAVSAPASALVFFRRSLRRLGQVGAVAPSSRWLASAVAEAGQVRRARTVVELGAGTGPVTSHLLMEMPLDARLLAFEIDPHFLRHLETRIRDPRLALVARSAEHLGRELAARGLGPVDCVASCLPLQLLDAPLRGRILDGVRASLAPGGRFVCFGYMPLAPGFLRHHFRQVRAARWVWRNLPPALVTVAKP